MKTRLVSIQAVVAMCAVPQLSLAEGAGMWKLDKTFEYNPRIVVSRNRLDLKVTVVAADKKCQ